MDYSSRTRTRPRALVTAAELAELLGVTPAYVRKRTRQHTIPAVNIRAGLPGRPAYRYDPDRVLARLEQLAAPW